MAACAAWIGSFAARIASAQDATTVQGSHTDQVEPLTIMTWNVEWFFDDNDGDNFSKLAKEKTAPSRGDWDWHRDAVAHSIAQSKPSILALQEVENRRVLWYLSRALDRSHKLKYSELCDESGDHFTEQDVGFMYRSPIDVLQTRHHRLTRAMKKTEKYFDLSKHIVGLFEVPNGTDTPEHVTVLNLHLRSRAEGESIRKRQARLAHLWMRDMIATGANVIILGDTNTEEKGDTTLAESDLGILSGAETESTADDLVDITLNLAREDRRTHLLPDRQFDRILVSQSLIDDDPSRPDLVFSKIDVLRDLAIQGELDTEAEHWEEYWQRDPKRRDLSDHLPVQATFEIK
ncbi:Endonuclease/Exonuclease/phosphatase family protein [Planctomycetes bacterium K23_9]|uniref:Endonuclease/Exonuclease/phosphatase family protein n=2 Tax=Stieleria marina TaxID=1930275 RepID=A0A517NY57_9BACT|nr:Endonuclease/Exonuclease/phosphatase family protein [Planctomycetes bacterium K23_9]